MGDKTDKLITDCEDWCKQVEEWIGSAKQSKKTLEGSIKLLQKKVEDPGVEKWIKENETVTTETTFYQNAITMIGLRTEAAEKAAKELESKVKVKKVLDFFKTQKTLDSAKKVLKETQECIKKGKTAKTANENDMKNLKALITTADIKQSQKVAMRENNMDILKKALVKVSNGIKAVIVDHLVWDAQLKDPIRVVAAQCSKMDQFSEHTAAWSDAGKDAFIAGLDEKEIKKKAQIVAKLYNKLNPLVG